LPPHPAHKAAFAEPVKLVCFGLCIANAVLLATMFMQGLWLIEPGGGGVPTDFVGVWAAGRLLLDGHPAGAYDWALHKQVEDLAVGHAFAGYFAWYYPPFFLPVAAPLALMPYALASAVWSLATFPAYLATIRRIVGQRVGLLLACAVPALVANFVVGQNGFLTAALLGGALAALPRRPLLAGYLLGLMTYKPQFGILLPLVLVAGGHWRAFLSAAAVALVLVATSLLAFGLEPWWGFLHNLHMANETVMSHGDADLQKMQTLFGLARALGVPEHAAWLLQSALSLAVAGALWLVWRSKQEFEIKAAAAAVGALLATPYLYMYDLVVLAVPMAFLVRAGRNGAFLSHEWAALGLACLLLLSFPFVKLPVGFLAVAIVAGLVARRAVASFIFPGTAVPAR
jgi:hypothetical protein